MTYLTLQLNIIFDEHGEMALDGHMFSTHKTQPLTPEKAKIVQEHVGAMLREVMNRENVENN